MSRSRSFSSLVLTLAAVGCGPAPSGGGIPLGQTQQGIATFYDATGAGNCSFDPSPGDLMVAAMNAPQYANSAVCGECVKVEGPSGSVVVRIVDQCPDCGTGHLDLSREAFALIADPKLGRVNIQWTPVSCAVGGPVAYHFKDHSSQWWTAIQVRNHRLPIQKMEWGRDGVWHAMERQDYNFFLDDGGVGPSAFRVRITSVDGQQLEDALPGPLDDQTVNGAAQFEEAK